MADSVKKTVSQWRYEGLISKENTIILSSRGLYTTENTAMNMTSQYLLIDPSNATHRFGDYQKTHFDYQLFSSRSYYLHAIPVRVDK